MADDGSRHKTIEAGVTNLALTCRNLAKLTLTWPEDDSNSDQFDDRGKLVFLSMMSHSIAFTLKKQNGCEEMAKIWQELEMALSDVVHGKNAELFRPLKEEGAQPRRLSVSREMYFSVAAAVYDLAEAGAKENVLKEIAGKLNVKPSKLKDFRGNLTRGDPNIKSAEATGYYDRILQGIFRVDENGQPLFRFDENGQPLLDKGKPSPTAHWLKWFDTLLIVEV